MDDGDRTATFELVADSSDRGVTGFANLATQAALLRDDSECESLSVDLPAFLGRPMVVRWRWL